MSEKATLLTTIPPVKKAESDSGNKAPLLSSPNNSEGKVSLLSKTKDVSPAPSVRETALNNQEAAKSPAETEAQAVETVSSEAVPEEPNSITAFQFVTYVSFVLNFILAGAVALILFKKAAKLAEERFVISAKALGIAGVLVMLHGFFATYLYSSYLNDAVSSAPLFLTMAVWVLVGPAVGFIARSLLARQEKPNRIAATIDAVIYGFIFFFAALGVSSGIKTNAALLFSIFACFLMIVPIVRSMSAFKVARARHRELNEIPNQILIYALLFVPALLPVLSFAHVCGLSAVATLFLINFITFDFMLVASLSMIASADQFESGADFESASQGEESKAAEKAAVPTKPDGPVPAPAPVAQRPKPEKVASGNPNDPIIQFLNSEGDDDEKTSAPSRPAARNAPPRKPGKPGVTPPKKPGSSKENKAAPNAPSRLKAPAKPKKRF